jgi:hypothetical protein
MKFQSRKDLVISAFILRLNVFLIGIAILGHVNGEMEQHEYWILIPI